MPTSSDACQSWYGQHGQQDQQWQALQKTGELVAEERGSRTHHGLLATLIGFEVQPPHRETKLFQKTSARHVAFRTLHTTKGRNGMPILLVFTTAYEFYSVFVDAVGAIVFFRLASKQRILVAFAAVPVAAALGCGAWLHGRL